MLMKFGLWEKQVTFVDFDNMTMDLMERCIVDTFPALRGIGFELCTASSGNHELEMIDHKKLTPADFRRVIGQARVYLRPSSDIEVPEMMVCKDCLLVQYYTPATST